VRGQERTEVVGGGHGRQAAEDIAKVIVGIVTVALAGDDERVNDRWAVTGVGKRSAILYSLVLSCKRHGKDPLAYLRDVLTRLPAMTNQDSLDPLLPSFWTPTHATSTSA
jgi:hypothetical protein